MEKEVLLSNIDKLTTKTLEYTPQSRGSYPSKRPLLEYLKYGVILLDKPQNPSSHEVVTWIKNILKCERTGHSGTLDPKVSGLLTVSLNRATRLVKSQQEAGKEYVAIIEFERPIDDIQKFKNALKFFTGKLLQRPPLMCAVKRNLRLRQIYEIEFIEVKKKFGPLSGLL